MGIILLVIIALYLIGSGYGSYVLWGGAALILLYAIGTLISGVKKAASPGERPRVRIDHPHYVAGDEYECGICGNRFYSPLAACPHCGVRFNCRQTDEDEYDDELDDELDMDEWDD